MDWSLLDLYIPCKLTMTVNTHYKYTIYLYTIYTLCFQWNMSPEASSHQTSASPWAGRLHFSSTLDPSCSRWQTGWTPAKLKPRTRSKTGQCQQRRSRSDARDLTHLFVVKHTFVSHNHFGKYCCVIGGAPPILAISVQAALSLFFFYTLNEYIQNKSKHVWQHLIEKQMCEIEAFFCTANRRQLRVRFIIVSRKMDFYNLNIRNRPKNTSVVEMIEVLFRISDNSNDFFSK